MENIDDSNFDLDIKDVKGLVDVLKVADYKDHKIYVMRFPLNVFAYFVYIDDNLYFAHIKIDPEEGIEKLTEEEIRRCTGITLAGGEATVDARLEVMALREFEEKPKIKDGKTK